MERPAKESAMKFRISVLLLIMALPLVLLAAEEATPATPKPTILKRWMRTFGLAKDPSTTTATGLKGLEIGVQVDPPAVNVTEVKQMKVYVRLVNRGKKMVQLDFPSSQRVEVLLKDKDGKTVEQWSEDQAFTNEPSMVTINSGERIEYLVSMSTRDMMLGQTYTVDAFFPNFEQLRKSTTVAATNVPMASPTPTPTPIPGTKVIPTAPVATPVKKPKVQ